MEKGCCLEMRESMAWKRAEATDRDREQGERRKESCPVIVTGRGSERGQQENRELGPRRAKE